MIQLSILATGFITLLSTIVPVSSNIDNDLNMLSSSVMDNNTTLCEVVMLGPTKEKSTGILFPQLCNGMQFVGCGVRVKYGFVKV